jgi:type I restriction enzyme M protein
MLANPPYGKSWKSDLERMGGKKELKDPRFVISHDGDPEYSLITRSSDGQMLFLVNMLSKMKHDTPLGSRIAEVHNGSSLFTGDALFDNPASVREELEQLVNGWEKGDAEEEDGEGESETPRRSLPEKKKKRLLSEATWKRDALLVEVATRLRETLGDGLFEDHNVFLDRVEAALKELGLKPGAAERKLIVNAVSWRVEDAPRVIKKLHKPGKTQPDPLRGLFQLPSTSGRGAGGEGHKAPVVEYEPDSELRDYEQVPLLEPGGVEGFIRREVLPYTPDAWIVEPDTKIGYEISFTRHFYKPPELRTLAQISADILALEQETEGLLSEITKGATG